MKEALINHTFSRRRSIMLLMFVVIAFGLVARNAIPIESNPKIDVPVFVVTVIHEGISPEDATQLIVQPLEQELESLDGLDETNGYGNEGAATVIVEFGADSDLDSALLDVREAVDRAKVKFPLDAEEPIVSELSTSDFPILQVNLVADGFTERALTALAKNLQTQLESISGVLEAQLQGSREDVLEVVIDPATLNAYQITLDQLAMQLQRNTRLIPAGYLDSGDGKISVKIPSVVEEARDLWDIPVKSNPDTVIRLGDVAQVNRTYKDKNSFSRVNGQNSLSLNIFKRANANEINVANAVKANVEAWRETAPSQVDVFYTNDQSPYALRQVEELEGNILTALVIVMVLVVGSMGFRSGVIVGASIPVSFLFAIAVVWLMGFTFNFMVLFGMLLGLGMLIDGAIVITEYADRKMIEGNDRHTAYAMAAKRMFWPVTASVATTLAAFFPLLFWPGVSGKFMSYLPATVFAVLSGSLLYALLFGPILGSAFGKPGTLRPEVKARMETLDYGDPTTLKTITGTYAKMVAWSTKHAWFTVLTTIGVLIVSFMLYNSKQLGMIFFESDPQFATVSVKARGNLTSEQASDLVAEVEDRVLYVPGLAAINAVTSIQTGGFFSRGDSSEDIVGTLFIELKDQKDRELTGEAIINVMRDRVSDIAGIEVEVQGMENGPPVGKALQIEFSSNYRNAIPDSVRQVRAYIEENVSGLIEIEDSLSVPGIQWKIDVDRAQAALYSADVSLVGMAVQLVTNGIFLGEYRPDDVDEAVDIRVRYPDGKRGLNTLEELRIATPSGLVPLSNFVKREPVNKIETIARRDRNYIYEIKANVAPGVLADAKVREISTWLDQQQFDPRVNIRFRGANEEQQESIEFVIRAFMFALCLMFVLLVTQFNSLYQSFLILFSVIMSTAGVLVGLVIMDRPFSAILTGIGIVALAGIVVNNNIVLIDTYNQLKREHPELDYLTLIVRTGAQRFRPVMLTTATTVMGLLPLASNISMDFYTGSIVVDSSVSSFWVPLAQAIVFGLTLATLLTLFCTPAMLAIPHQLRGLGRRLKSMRQVRQPQVTADSTV